MQQDHEQSRHKQSQEPAKQAQHEQQQHDQAQLEQQRSEQAQRDQAQPAFQAARPLRKLHFVWLQAAVEVLYLFPLLLAAALYFAPTVPVPVWFAGMFVVMLLGSLFGRMLPPRRLAQQTVTWLCGTIAASIAVFVLVDKVHKDIATTWLAVPQWEMNAVWLLACFAIVVAAVLFYRGASLEQSDWGEVIPVGLLWLSVIVSGLLYAMTTVLPFFQDFGFYPYVVIFADYQAWIAGLGVASFLLTLLLNNVQQLRSVAHIEKSVLTIRDILNNQINVIFVIAFIGVAYLVVRHFDIYAFFSAAVLFIMLMAYFMREDFGYILRRALYVALFFVVVFAAYHLVSTLLNLFSDTGGAGGLPDELADQDEGIFSRVSNAKWIIYGSLAVIALFALFFARDLFRLLRWAWRRIAAMIKAWWNRILGEDKWQPQGYEEEKIRLDMMDDVRESAEQFQQWVTRKLRGEPRWSELKNNRERVRYLYRHVVQRAIRAGYPFRKAHTPRETLQQVEKWGQKRAATEELAAWYDQVRYGERDIDDATVERLRREQQ